MQGQDGKPPKLTTDKEKVARIISHTDSEIKGFFGEFRFLSNMYRAKVFLDGEEYVSVENAYQAAKYPKSERGYFKTCTPGDSKTYAIEHTEVAESQETWNERKVEVMKSLLVQKFDINMNPGLRDLLKQTGEKYLEETNYWGDTFWGVSKQTKEESGEGENNLGKLLMQARELIR